MTAPDAMLSGSTAETLSLALALVDNTLVDRALEGVSSAQAIASRLRELGIGDEPVTRRCAERVAARVGQATAFLTLVRELSERMFQWSHGTPVLRPTPLARRLARVIDADILVSMQMRDVAGDEAFDWAVVNLTDDDPGAAMLRDESIETHIHLGGTLPPLYTWLVLMSGVFPLEALRQAPSRARRQSDAEKWQKAMLRAMRLRLEIAWEVRKGGEDFSWVPKPLSAPRDTDSSIAFRDQVAERTVASRFSGAMLFQDPLQSENAIRPFHYAAMERRLLYRAVRRLYATGDARLATRLLDYIRVRSAFHGWMVHDYGSDGLARFVENFGRRRFLFRASRQRRVLIALETDRVLWALRGHVHEPFCGAPAASEPNQPLRRIEVRVSLPERYPLHSIRAWLTGLRRYLATAGAAVGKSAKRHSYVPRAQIGFVIHLLKRRVELAGDAVPSEREVAARTTGRNREVAEKLWCLLTDYPDLRCFIVGIDAAGEERVAPPRFFAPAFELLRKCQAEQRSVQRHYPLRLGWTYHVGEDVEDLLTGLRHLDEVAVLLFGGKPGRLGHALALGEDPRRFYARRGDETEVRVGTHLLDLVWAYGRLLGHDARGMIDCIRHRIAVVGRVHFRRGRDLDTCLEAMNLDTMPRSELPTLSSEAELLDKLVQAQLSLVG